MKRAALALAAFVWSATSCGCVGKVGPTGPASSQWEPQWQDAFSITPELVIMVRPRALRRDAVYGALLERAMELARARSRIVAATRVLDAIGDAEEVVVGMPSSRVGAPEELVVAVQGVRADIDPMKLTDSEGRVLWSPGPSGRVRELVGASDASNGHDVPLGVVEDGTREQGEASLFELPGRTWVIVTGEARIRARDAFAHPRVRSSIPIDPDALASLRIAGESLVAHVRALREGALAAVGRRLRALTLVLAPEDQSGDSGSAARGHSPDRSIQANWYYEEEDAAEVAEATMRRVIDAVAHTVGQGGRAATPGSDGPDAQSRARNTVGLEWLGRATLSRGHEPEGERAHDHRVVLTAALPHALLDDFLRSSSLTENGRTDGHTENGREFTRGSSGAQAVPASAP